jgi:hydroxymethylglutaryl-CoA lyase
MDQLLAATHEMSGVLGKPPVSRVASALNAKRKRASI